MRKAIGRVIAVLISIVFIAALPPVTDAATNGPSKAKASQVAPKPISRSRMNKIARAHAIMYCQSKTRFLHGAPFITCELDRIWIGSCQPDRVFYTVMGTCDAHFVLRGHLWVSVFQEWDATVHFHKWSGIIRRTRPTHWTHTRWSQSQWG